MATIFDYLEETGTSSIYDQDFGPLDVLSLTEITYLNFDGLGVDNIQTLPECRLLEIAELVPQELTMLTTKQRLLLLQKLAESTRFKNIKLMGYINDIDMELEKQFAAMTYRLSLDTYLVVFRGTDDSIIGWKEDFHMTYMNHIPAQKSALAYLDAIMRFYPKARFLVAGHSKGGNLATYAASFVNPDLQERIETIYSYDAPGLNKALIKTEGYIRATPKIERYIPQGSIVGMMLEIPEDVHIVASTGLGGIAQHNTFTWQTDGRDFVTLDQLTADSLQMDMTFKNWVRETPDEELKYFFDIFFSAILEAGITSIDDLSSLEGLAKINDIIRNLQNLEPQKQEMLNRLGKQLLDTRYQMWRDHRNEPSILSRLRTRGPEANQKTGNNESPENKE